MNINRIITALILSVLCFVLFIYPDPSGKFYDILRWFIFFLLIVILFQFSTENGKNNETYSDKPSTNNLKFSQSDGTNLNNNVQDQFNQLINIVFNMIKALHKEYQAVFYIIDNTGTQLHLKAETENGFKDSVEINNEIIQTILSQNDSILFQQMDVKEQWNGILKEKSWRGSECLIGSRVLFKNASIGCVILKAEHFSIIHERDKALLTNLCHFISVSIIKLDNLEKLSMDNFFHYQIANLLNSLDIQSEVKGLYEKVRDLSRSLFSYDKLTIAKVFEDKQKFMVVLEDGYTGDIEFNKEYAIFGCIYGIPMRKKTILQSSKIDEEFQENGRLIPGDLQIHHFESLVSIPVLIDGLVQYTITLEKQRSYNYSNADVNLLELLALTFGSIISWQQQYWKMRDNAMHDGLTNLLNHKAFMDRFSEEVSRAIRYQHNIVMAILDLDKFKRINDSYGHLYGDYVIREVANIIKENVRNIDVVGRYGGEEFAILLINTTTEKIVKVADRIIASVATFPFKMNNIEVKMTISCGLAEYPNDTNNITELIAFADEAMYNAKKKGGNLVEIYKINHANV